MIQAKQLAQKTNRSEATISRWLNRSRKISTEDARELERITGVPRLAWLYPDEYDNPYFKPAYPPTVDGKGRLEVVDQHAPPPDVRTR